MAIKNFDQIIEQAKQTKKRRRVVIAGADAENILLGAFEAQDAGFVTPVLVGEGAKITTLLDKLGLKDKPYGLVEPLPGADTIQTAIDLINQGRGDILMRGNTQTKDFLSAILNKKNNLRTDFLVNQIALVSMPEYPKLIAIGDVTVTIKPDPRQKKGIIRNMVETLEAVGYDTPNIALLSLIEEVSFHMKDTVEAEELVKRHKEKPIANCNLVGPIAYDLILSKEAARLKGYNNPLCGEFDGIVAPSLLAANLIVKSWQMHARAETCNVVVGAKIPVALTSRSDSKNVAFNSLAFLTVMEDSKL